MAETCDMSGSISSEGPYSIEGCKRVCDVSDNCIFLAHWPSGWCKLFKSCIKLESVKKPATTYKKVKIGKLI